MNVIIQKPSKINTTSSNIDSAKSQREIDKSVREKVNENSPLWK